VTRALSYALLLGIVGAALVHIAVLLLVPTFTDRDAWARLAERGEPFRFVAVSGSDAFARGANPFLRAVACRFSIEEGMVHIRASGTVPLWTAAIFDRSGQNIYSLNDRTTPSGELDIVVASPPQIIELRKEIPEEFDTSVFVGLETGEGIAVIRAALLDDSWSDLVSDFLDQAECVPLG